MTDNNEIIIVDETSLRDKIYIVRGEQVMMDSDLAEIYGYETRYLNLQVKRNINRFPEDFMFQLTKEEYDSLMLKFATSNRGGRRSLPFVFTEQGIYQLATVLKGEIAEQQSVAIMRVFRTMREYISENRVLLPKQELFRLSGRQAQIEGEIREIKDAMVTKADLSEFMQLFDQGVHNEEVLILDGQPFKADVAYQKIYRSAKKTVIVVDDYIGVKTLQHLVHAKDNVKLTIISDNKLKLLKLSEYNDFLTEYPKKAVDFIRSQDRAHDRYIVIDNGTATMKVYHCGASSKDAGKRITTITRLIDIDDYKKTIKSLLANPPLILK